MKDAAAPILVDAQADVDISDPAFDFIRSVRVFEITYRQNRSSDGDCNSWGTVYSGSYVSDAPAPWFRVSGFSGMPPCN